MIELLRGHDSWRRADGELVAFAPEEASARRAEAAVDAAWMGVLSPELQAALLLAAFGDGDEQVRTKSRHALISRCEEVGEAVLLRLTDDADPHVRLSVVDEALGASVGARRHRLLGHAISRLRGDDEAFVRDRIVALERCLSRDPDWVPMSRS